MDLTNISAMYNNARSSVGEASADSLQRKVNNLSSDASEEELKGVLKDFESYFVEQVIKKMKDTFTSDDDEDQIMSQYKDMYMDKAIELAADQIVDQIGGNYTQQLYEQMRRNLGMENLVQQESAEGTGSEEADAPAV